MTPSAAPNDSTEDTAPPPQGRDRHGMRPIAFAFALGNAAVLVVLAVVVASGHLDTGSALDIAATAAPTQ